MALVRKGRDAIGHSLCLCTVQFSSVAQSCPTPWATACQASLPITNSQNLLKLISIESVMPSNHLILVPSSSCLQSFPASGSFPRSQLFTSCGQSTGTSALVLPMSIQDWFPLGRTGWISLQTKGFSRVFSNTTVQNHQFFMHSLPYSHKMQRLLEIWPNKPQLPWILRNVALQVECYHCVWCWVRSRKLAKAHPLCKFQGHVLQTLKTHAFFYFFFIFTFFSLQYCIGFAIH